MSTSFNFDYLPEDVLTLSGYDFFQFIKTTLGEPEANLLNKISVKSTTSLIQTEDPLDIFNYDIDDEDLEKLKGQLSFKLKNEKILIKPGVISGFRTTKKKKQQQRQQLSNTNSSSISSLTLTTAQTPSVSNQFSLTEHKAHVLNLIRKWYSDNKENFNLESFNLEENIDCFLNISFDENTDVKANIKCKCNRLISLSKNDNKIQVSNFYKHLQSNGCDHMKHMKQAARDLNLSQQQQQSSTPNTLTSSQSHAPLIQVPAVSPINIQTTQTDSPALSNPAAYNGGKRRLTSQLQQYRSTKRSRI
ncbi:unnamed protein product [Rotaria magnacalcarata]|uniref:Uncharacterized protein n=3 Tax=Rotaria magnacalcarata TaxID=392030 RepID=A0A820NHH7_9BILA|nr:unnamed protein product [Rotaria magnacalcarata]CAF2071564.1 unnamed protein product [Rotaria magnacalcarata]CAF2149339.1 unnamed protein product [Rotaria magnacalcarata]CAF4245445.1 unnamed protein product [Rotaria magnacalcarata]CAF4387029.1 unnamed protein product [Rotaria magnacalcarata]